MTKLKDILSPAVPTPRPRKPLVTVEYDSDFCLWVTDGSHQPDGKPILTETQMRHAAEQYHLDIECSGYLENQATPTQKQRHIDLVDFLFNVPQK